MSTCNNCGCETTVEDLIFLCDCDGVSVCKTCKETIFNSTGPQTRVISCKSCGAQHSYTIRRKIAWEKFKLAPGRLRRMYLYSTLIFDIISIGVLTFVSGGKEVYNGNKGSYILLALAYTLVYIPLYMLIYLVHNRSENNYLKYITRDPIKSTFSFVYRLAVYTVNLILIVIFMIVGSIVLQSSVWSFWGLQVGAVVCFVVFGTPILVYFGCKKGTRRILDTYTAHEIEISDSQV